MDEPGGEGSGEAQIAIPLGIPLARNSISAEAAAEILGEEMEHRYLMTALYGKRSLGLPNETHILPSPQILPSSSSSSVGKLIDIPTTSSSSVSRDTQRLGVVNTTTNMVPPTEAPSGSGSVPILMSSEPAQVPDVAATSTVINETATSSSSSSTSSSYAQTSPSNSSSSTDTSINASEIIATIDTDTDDDVILVAPPMVVIDVDDEDDEEDVQIVSHTRSQPIPKPRTERKSRLTNTTPIGLPPVLPLNQFEIEEEIDTNLPVESILQDLLDSHFNPAHLDFTTLVDTIPPTSEKRFVSMLQSDNCRCPSITEEVRMLNNKEIAIQTEIFYQEVATQTDPIPEERKRKWEYNDDDCDGTSCPICLEPWEEGGDHRLVSLKCGHLFGEGCLQQWFNQSTVVNRKVCPVCRAKASIFHIRPLFARRVVQIKYDRLDEVKAELAKFKKRYSQLEQQLHRTQQQQQQQQQPVQLSLPQIPPPVSHHGPSPASGPHATGPFHPTSNTVINPNISQFPTMDRIPVYGAPAMSGRMHDFMHPFRQVHHVRNMYTHEQDYSI